jgi:hypothetical protein
MPETTTTTEPVSTESLGWRAGLPDELKQNAEFVPFKTVGDFAKSYLETKTKAADVERKLGDYVPKLPDNATDEERGLYYDALGRPKTASEYEFEGEDKNAPEWTNLWKGNFYSLGLTKDQAKKLSGSFNTQIQAMVKAHNDGLQNEMKVAEQKLRSEEGDKYDSSVELAKRMWTKYGEGDFDKAFENGGSAYRSSTIRMLLKFARLTGEDRSPQSTNTVGTAKSTTFINYDKSPAPPQRS